jgi:hypothetical protein
MSTYHLVYRGYKIKIMRRDSDWHIEALPASPSYPYLQLFSFSVDVGSDQDAIKLIQNAIDRSLET